MQRNFFHPEYLRLFRGVVCFFILFLLGINPVSAQPGWHSDDVVTYFDGRDVRSVDVTTREIVFATSGGLWRFDRFTGEPLAPWAYGIGRDSAVSLAQSRIILWHPESQTLWLVAGGSLLYYRRDTERWDVMSGISGSGITSLGDTGTLLLVESRNSVTVIDPTTLQILGIPQDQFDNVRWQGQRGWKPHAFPNYRVSDIYLRFDSRDGKVSDWDWSEFKPVFDLFDSEFQRRYICYPGFGIGFADERNLRIEFFQPGPAGVDVRSFAFAEDGKIWIGGNNKSDRDGLSIFDRRTGRWQRFGRKLTDGFESNRIFDIALTPYNAYFATDAGLSVCNLANFTFRTLTRFDGLHGIALRALAISGNVLFIGGDQGVNTFTLPNGPIFKSGSPKLDELRTAQFATDGDTFWVAGLQGVWRSDPDGRWSPVISNTSIGNEPSNCLALTPTFLYIGSSGGVRILDRTSGAWHAWTSGAYYLQNNAPTAIAANDSLVWIGTKSGIFRHNLYDRKWLVYSSGEGFPTGGTSRLVLEADTLWAGTPRGLIRFLWNRPDRDF